MREPTIKPGVGLLYRCSGKWDGSSEWVELAGQFGAMSLFWKENLM